VGGKSQIRNMNNHNMERFSRKTIKQNKINGYTAKKKKKKQFSSLPLFVKKWFSIEAKINENFSSPNFVAIVSAGA
jgi:hypothetical protein